MLSPEAKEFVPRQLNRVTDSPGGFLHPGDGAATPDLGDGNSAGQHPINGIPSYMTTCYPFVSNSDQRFGGGRQRMRGKIPQVMTPPQYQSMQQGMPRNRYPHPSKSYWNWNQAAMSDVYPPFSNMPNGMPFDGGTYQNGFVRPSHIPHMAVHDPKSVIPPRHTFSSYSPSPSDMYGENNKLVNGYPKTDSGATVNATGDASLGSGRRVDLDSRRTVCYKNSSIQTDFPAHIANSTLDDLPNSLFNQKHSAHRVRHKTWPQHNDPNLCPDSDDELDSGYGSAFHKKNQVSNGTNPAADVAVGNRSGLSLVGSQSSGLYPGKNGSEFSDKKSRGDMSSMQGVGNKVPLACDNRTAMFSYASIAQSKPSHKKQSAVQAPNKSDPASCDKNNSSSKKVLRSSAKLGYNSLNVNVAQIMEDLEKADSIQKLGGEEVEYVETRQTPALAPTQVQPGSYKASLLTKPPGQLSYNAVVKQSSPKPTTTPNINNKTTRSSLVEENRTESHKGSQVKGQGGDHGNSKLNSEGQGHISDPGDGIEVKKKRKRRRRRKRKSGDGGENEEGNDDGANDEITLHFEDEEEFPDLLSAQGGSDPKSSSLGLANTSYSEVLKTSNPVQSTIPATPSSQEDPPCTQENSGAMAKESRNSRKRRKRREVANKAADAEMAEINLEQHMLELKMKQKHPMAAKKSVSPVRASPSQGVWKLPPSSPVSQSSSGKKVSLLLPGTVAPETPVSTPPQPLPASTATKQHGILKTSQPVSQPASQPASGGGGGGGGGGKKSKQPITYDLSAMIDALEAKKETPPPKKEVKPVVVKKKDDPSKPHNILDSTAPVKRGKERETPKLKKPSPLKKVILKEREEKKRLRLLDEDETTSGIDTMHASVFPTSPISAPVGMGLVSGESDLSQDAGSSKGSMEVSLGTPASAELSPISQPSPTCMSPMSPGASPLSSGVNSPITGTLQQTVKLKIHSRRFREYCNQVLDKEIDNSVTLLLTDLVRFQDKQYHKDPIKAKAKRRFVLGLREVTKHLKLRKVKCVIISPNLEKIQSKGGLDDALNNILDLCQEQKVPFVFALGRRALGRACAKLVPVSVVGVFNFEGSEENFRQVVSLTEKARDAYREMILQIEKELAEHPPRTGAPGLPHIFAHMGHSRTPSGCSVISFTSSILSEPISENYPYSEPETDNRGYEIEKTPADDADINQNNILKDSEKDPYEADDESGFERSKRSSSKVISSSGFSSGKPGKDSDTRGSDKCELSSDLERVKLTDDMPAPDRKDIDDKHDDERDDIGDGNDQDNVDSDNSNDLDFETCEEEEDDDDEEDTEDEEDDDSDPDNCKEGADTIEDLPQFIESVHHYDLNEILSQHSSKTIENGEDVMSTHSSKTTHSSRTLGDGSTHHVDKSCLLKIEIKNQENQGLGLRGKPSLDKENRTLSWVKEAQNLHFSEKGDEQGEAEESCHEIKSVTRECLDAVA